MWEYDVYRKSRITRVKEVAIGSTIAHHKCHSLHGGVASWRKEKVLKVKVKKREKEKQGGLSFEYER